MVLGRLDMHTQNKCEPCQSVQATTTKYHRLDIVYKQQKFISYRSGCWEVKDQGASMVPEPGALLLCLHSVKEARDFSGASESDNSIQGKVPMMETIPKG